MTAPPVAARRSQREDLAGIEQVVRIERALDQAHLLDRRAELGDQPVLLAQPDAVLAGASPVHRQRALDQPGVERLDLGELLGAVGIDGEIVLSCGVLEYVPLDAGLREMARVLKTGARLVFIPVKPSFVGSVLEILYNFKTHPIKNVRKISQQYFNIVGRHKFPITEPISWSKTIFLLEKK